jgi:hypothetical protein
MAELLSKIENCESDHGSGHGDRGPATRPSEQRGARGLGCRATGVVHFTNGSGADSGDQIKGTFHVGLVAQPESCVAGVKHFRLIKALWVGDTGADSSEAH